VAVGAVDRLHRPAHRPRAVRRGRQRRRGDERGSGAVRMEASQRPSTPPANGLRLRIVAGERRHARGSGQGVPRGAPVERESARIHPTVSTMIIGSYHSVRTIIGSDWAPWVGSTNFGTISTTVVPCQGKCHCARERVTAMSVRLSEDVSQVGGLSRDHRLPFHATNDGTDHLEACQEACQCPGATDTKSGTGQSWRTAPVRLGRCRLSLDPPRV